MFRILPNKFRNICFLLFLLCFIFSSNTLSWAECSETGNYLICEDWDTGTPPDPWPTQDGATWHGWIPADYGGGDDGDVTGIRSHSGQRSLVLLKGDGEKSTVDLGHAIPGNPPVVYVRFYVYLPSEEIWNIGSFAHLVFLNSASSAECCLDFRGRSFGFCKPTDRNPSNCCPYNEGYSDPNRPCHGENAKGYEWTGHVMLAPHTYGPEDWAVETEGVPFFWEEHTDEWVLVEWKVDFANDKTSLWINEIPYIVNYDMDFSWTSGTSVVFSGFTQNTSGNIHYHIDDIVVSTSYIGPKDGGPPNEDSTSPNTSNLSPAKNASNVPPDTNISVHVQDNGDGVDQSSIAMKVNGEIVSPSISGVPSDYTLVYDPPEDFEPGQTVSVTIDAQDLHYPANEMQGSYSFTIAGQSGGSNTKTFGNTISSDFPNTIQDTSILLNTDNMASSQNLFTYTWPSDKPANAIIMKCDLSAIPASAQIESANLYLYMNQMEDGGGDAQYDMSVHKIINYNPDINQCTGHTYDGTNGWTPNNTCNNGVPLAQADITAAEDVQSVDKTYGYKIWGVTSMVQEWVANPDSNFGLVVNSDTSASADSNRIFASSETSDPSQRPKLVVTYIAGSEVNVPPTIGSFTTTPSSLNNPGETTTFNVSATDPDGDSLTYTVNFGDGTANGSGSQVEHTYETKGTYTAEVTVNDGNGNTVGEFLQITVDDVPPTKPTSVIIK